MSREIYGRIHMVVSDDGRHCDEACQARTGNNRCERYGFIPWHGNAGAYSRAGACLAAERAAREATPEPMSLLCPACSEPHVDRNEWATRPHKTHLCEHCGHLWRPFEYATVGIDDAPPSDGGAHGIDWALHRTIARLREQLDETLSTLRSEADGLTEVRRERNEARKRADDLARNFEVLHRNRDNLAAQIQSLRTHFGTAAEVSRLESEVGRLREREARVRALCDEPRGYDVIARAVVAILDSGDEKDGE